MRSPSRMAAGSRSSEKRADTDPMQPVQHSSFRWQTAFSGDNAASPLLCRGMSHPCIWNRPVCCGNRHIVSRLPEKAPHGKSSRSKSNALPVCSSRQTALPSGRAFRQTEPSVQHPAWSGSAQTHAMLRFEHIWIRAATPAVPLFPPRYGEPRRRAALLPRRQRHRLPKHLRPVH